MDTHDFYIMNQRQRMSCWVGQQVIDALVIQRFGARDRKDYAEADRLREEIRGHDVQLEDTEWGGMRLFHQRGFGPADNRWGLHPHSRYTWPGVLWQKDEKGKPCPSNRR